MKLTFPHITKPMTFEEGYYSQLILEDKEFFRKVIFDIQKQINGEEGKILISENSQSINMKKDVEIIQDWMNIDLNDRKILKGIYDVIGNIQLEESYEEWHNLLSANEEYIIKMIEKTDYPLVYDSDMECQDFYKLYNIKISMQVEEFIGNIIKYLEVMTDILKKKIFVFVNCYDYLSKTEVEELCEYICNNNLKVLFLDSKEELYISKKCRRVIIDNDYCELVNEF